MALWEAVVHADGPAGSLFSAEAAAEYARTVGREVRIDEIQPVVNELLADNILMGSSHSRYDVSDPYVKEICRERQSLPSGA